MVHHSSAWCFLISLISTVRQIDCRECIIQHFLALIRMYRSLTNTYTVIFPDFTPKRTYKTWCSMALSILRNDVIYIKNKTKFNSYNTNDKSNWGDTGEINQNFIIYLIYGWTTWMFVSACIDIVHVSDFIYKRFSKRFSIIML